MTKELQLSNFPKLEGFIKEVLDRFAVDWPKILGQGANLVFNNFDCLVFDKFTKEINNEVFVLEYEISGEREGKMHLIFKLRDVVIISGSILMEEEDEIKTSLSDNKMTDDYMDAFGEFGNQVAASFETIFRKVFPDEDDNHIRFVKMYNPPFEADSLKDIFLAESDDEILITRTQCSIWSFDKGDIGLSVVADVGEGFFDEIVTASTKKIFAHVMYVDSSKKEVATVKKMFRNSGYFVHACYDADTAIAKLQQEKIDIVLINTDFNNNAEEGLALCVRIKRNMLLEDIPVIMTSGSATKKLVLDCVRIGAADFLVKPFDKEQVFSKIEKRIKRKRLSK